jgi:gas vesicle protein GvpL/GvpF
MSLLTYCILLDGGSMNFPSAGVLGAEIEPIAESGLIALCSEIERSAISANNFQQAALEFHHVVQAVFADKALIPFRFPTWLSPEEMRANLRQETPRYKNFLLSHADHVQMEVRIQAEAAGSPLAATGVEHLRARAAQLRKVSEQAGAVRHQLADTVIEWRERESADGIRLYALVSRKSGGTFREKLNRLSVRASGPWPATEFFVQQREED